MTVDAYTYGAADAAGAARNKRIPAVAAGDQPDDCKPQSGATIGPPAHVIEPNKPLEHSVSVNRGDSRSVVGDLDDYGVEIAVGGQLNAMLRVPLGIVDQIAHSAGQLTGIAPNAYRWRVDADLDAFA